MNKPELIYIYDALCGWCFGFIPVIKKLQNEYRGQYSFRVISGGMNMGTHALSAFEIAPFIRSAHGRVEELSGVKFRKAFFENILDPGTAILDSLPPALALTALKSVFPEKQVDCAHGIQQLLYTEGKDLSKPENYRELFLQLGADADALIHEMNSENNFRETQKDFDFCRMAGITGFPALILHSNDEWFLVARGFTPYDQVVNTLNSIMSSQTQNSTK